MRSGGRCQCQPSPRSFPLPTRVPRKLPAAGQPGWWVGLVAQPGAPLVGRGGRRLVLGAGPRFAGAGLAALAGAWALSLSDGQIWRDQQVATPRSVAPRRPLSSRPDN